MRINKTIEKKSKETHKENHVENKIDKRENKNGYDNHENINYNNINSESIKDECVNDENNNYTENIYEYFINDKNIPNKSRNYDENIKKGNFSSDYIENSKTVTIYDNSEKSIKENNNNYSYEKKKTINDKWEYINKEERKVTYTEKNLNSIIDDSKNYADNKITMNNNNISYYEKTLQDENEISDISTDEILSDLDTESDEEKIVEEIRKYNENIYENFNNNEICILSEDIKRKEKLLEEENKNIWNLKNRCSKIEKCIEIKKKKITYIKTKIDEKTGIELEEEEICKNTEIKNNFLKKENRKLKLEREKNNEKIIKTQDDLEKCENDIEEIKKKLIYKEEELNEWIKRVNKIQEEEYEIEKFRLSKDKEIGKLSLNLEKLSEQKVEYEKNLNSFKTKNMKLNIELKSITNEIQETEKEKKDLFQKWKCILDSINSRDETIFKFEEDFRKYLNKEKKLQQKSEKIVSNINAQKSKNNEINDKIKVSQLDLNKLRKEVSQVNYNSNKIIIERDNLYKDYESEKLNLKEKYEEKKNLEAYLNELLKDYDKLLINREESKKEFIKEELKNVEKNELIKSSEKILNELQNKLRNLISEIKSLDEEKFCLSEALQKSKNEYSILESNVFGTQVKIKQIKNNIKKIEQELERQKEILYKFDFQTQVLTKKLSVISGISTFEKKKENQKKITTLEKELSQYESIFNTLNNEIKSINVELKNIKIYQNNLKEEKTNILNLSEKLQLEIKSLENTLNNENKEKENIMLIEMNLKIELDKLKAIFSKHLDNLNHLKEKKKEKFKDAKLNDQDISANIESLKIIIKNINEEVHKLNMQLYDKKNRCNHLESKLNSIIEMNKTEEDDSINDENHNKYIYYKIKMEEDTIKLKEEIKKIDDKIIKEREETNNFQKTLNDILQANKIFNDNINCIDPQYKSLLKKKNKLNKKLNEINEEIRITEKNISDHNMKIENIKNELNSLLLKSENIEKDLEIFKENSKKMENLLNELYTKIERASNHLKNVLSIKQKSLKVKTKNESTHEIDNNITEQVSLEKKIFKHIQMESLREKLSLLFDCFKDEGDNTLMKEIFNIIKTCE
ncbi:conserved Plasmodium protein, unknown function [Plasmodium gallinaceum]|uniref:Uncharacterized protein n=1 Tax=Plasmodium gallinaceum TaxID=5849 RepID=A0A1J1GM92_PLAGA|nr:conserved Plasmodium protein, unknown function [Plasmodium gallinaceum]CRG93513.1 conserved Plasmodium protein, unknown function [Plasmodium gallinaceum]